MRYSGTNHLGKRKKTDTKDMKKTTTTKKKKTDTKDMKKTKKTKTKTKKTDTKNMKKTKKTKTKTKKTDTKNMKKTKKTKTKTDIRVSGKSKSCTLERKSTRMYLKSVLKIKKKARSELRQHEWSKHGYCDSHPERVDTIGPLTSRILELDGSDLSFAAFSHRIEKKNTPCLLHNLLRHWPAMTRWGSVERLMDQLKGVACKIGSDDDGYAVRMTFENFVRYLDDPEQGRKDDSPLYIFDSTLVQKTTMKQDYIVPYIFSEDLLKYAGERSRPPYQWMCIGGVRSGTSIHVDPLGTSAWNALVQGHKRWALFPPKSVPEDVLKPKGVHSAARWFDIVWPETQKESWPYVKPIHAVQGPGDVIFVPSGWWHVVINLDFTVAVTHNFCSSANFHTVFMHTRISRPKMTTRWLTSLGKERPDLAAIGQEIINDDQRCSDISSPSSSSSESSSSESSSSESSSSESNITTTDVNPRNNTNKHCDHTVNSSNNNVGEDWGCISSSRRKRPIMVAHHQAHPPTRHHCPGDRSTESEDTQAHCGYLRQQIQ